MKEIIHFIFGVCCIHEFQASLENNGPYSLTAKECGIAQPKSRKANTLNTSVNLFIQGLLGQTQLLQTENPVPMPYLLTQENKTKLDAQPVPPPPPPTAEGKALLHCACLLSDPVTPALLLYKEPLS